MITAEELYELYRAGAATAGVGVDAPDDMADWEKAAFQYMAENLNFGDELGPQFLASQGG